MYGRLTGKLQHVERERVRSVWSFAASNSDCGRCRYRTKDEPPPKALGNGVIISSRSGVTESGRSRWRCVPAASPWGEAVVSKATLREILEACRAARGSGVADRAVRLGGRHEAAQRLTLRRRCLVSVQRASTRRRGRVRLDATARRHRCDAARTGWGSSNTAAFLQERSAARTAKSAVSAKSQEAKPNKTTDSILALISASLLSAPSTAPQPDALVPCESFRDPHGAYTGPSKSICTGF